MAEFWIRNTAGSDYEIVDLGLLLPDGEEIDLHLSCYFEDIRRSVDLDTALAAGDLVRLTGQGGSVIPYAQAYDDAVAPHEIGGNAHYGQLSTDEVTEGTSNLYYTEGRVSANTDVAANTAHRGDASNPHATDVGNLGSGTLAELNIAITDATLDDSGDPRDPTAHASSHINGGTDIIPDVTLTESGLMSPEDKTR